MRVIVVRRAPFSGGDLFVFQRVLVFEDAVTADVDHLVIGDLRRIVDSKRPTQFVSVHQRVQSAEQLERNEQHISINVILQFGK